MERHMDRAGLERAVECLDDQAHVAQRAAQVIADWLDAHSFGRRVDIRWVRASAEAEARVEAADAVRVDAVTYGWRFEEPQVADLLGRLAHRFDELLMVEDRARGEGDFESADRARAAAAAWYDAHAYVSAFAEIDEA